MSKVMTKGRRRKEIGLDEKHLIELMSEFEITTSAPLIHTH
jgi:hypothetical protein